MTTGYQRITDTFQQARNERRAALMPYYPIGFPHLQLSQEIVLSIAESGADLIELGMPFSDPLADGPTIQRATQIALENGASLAFCLETVQKLRRQGVNQPLVMMGYYNPILAYGIDRFVAAAATSGVDGLIIPDLPPEEAGDLESACGRYNLALIFLLAPTSTDERIRLVTGRARGFIYLVSLTGVTGVRQILADDLPGFIARVRRYTQIPLAVGFGISTAEQVRRISHLADGVIIGSALINSVEQAEDPRRLAGEFIAALRPALTIDEQHDRLVLEKNLSGDGSSVV